MPRDSETEERLQNAEKALDRLCVIASMDIHEKPENYLVVALTLLHHDLQAINSRLNMLVDTNHKVMSLLLKAFPGLQGNGRDG